MYAYLVLMLLIINSVFSQELVKIKDGNPGSAKIKEFHPLSLKRSCCSALCKQEPSVVLASLGKVLIPEELKQEFVCNAAQYAARDFVVNMAAQLPSHMYSDMGLTVVCNRADEHENKKQILQRLTKLSEDKGDTPSSNVLKSLSSCIEALKDVDQPLDVHYVFSYAFWQDHQELLKYTATKNGSYGDIISNHTNAIASHYGTLIVRFKNLLQESILNPTVKDENRIQAESLANVKKFFDGNLSETSGVLADAYLRGQFLAGIENIVATGIGHQIGNFKWVSPFKINHGWPIFCEEYEKEMTLLRYLLVSLSKVKNAQSINLLYALGMLKRAECDSSEKEIERCNSYYHSMVDFYKNNRNNEEISYLETLSEDKGYCKNFKFFSLIAVNSQFFYNKLMHLIVPFYKDHLEVYKEDFHNAGIAFEDIKRLAQKDVQKN